ncbi:MAG: hypothetical protein LLG01_09870 [Planctomycetaceae bacterium]|nr:hypothetical protein [Planctomycetaceae bacterium]
MAALIDTASLQQAVRRCIASTPITDIHTHLFPPSHGGLMLWGIDDLLTYHYLVAELFMVAPRSLTPEKFWAMPKAAQADLVWKHVFIEGGAMSEVAGGVVTTLNLLGIDAGPRDLSSIRKWYAAQTAEDYLARVFEQTHIDYAVMTNDPFKAEEVKCWKAKPVRPVPAFLKTALRIDTLIVDWPGACRLLQTQGYDAQPAGGSVSFAEARRFLLDWAKILKPTYLAASLPPTFVYPEGTTAPQVVQNVVVPVAMELGVPLAMMIGVRRGVNPPLRDGGDGLGVADVRAVENLCREFPSAKFIVTMLARANQHELTVLGRKFRNLHIEGCWWFCNNASIIEEMTRMRLELLGTAFTLQHSDARVVDQVIYKWAHAKRIAEKVLVERYTKLFNDGWRPTEPEIARDIRNLFGGAFKAFLAK